MMGKKFDFVTELGREGLCYALANANRMTPPVMSEYMRHSK